MGPAEDAADADITTALPSWDLSFFSSILCSVLGAEEELTLNRPLMSDASSDGGTEYPVWGSHLVSRKALVGAVRLITCRFVVNLWNTRRVPYGTRTVKVTDVIVLQMLGSPNNTQEQRANEGPKHEGGRQSLFPVSTKARAPR
jgi:hypothetical protein